MKEVVHRVDQDLASERNRSARKTPDGPEDGHSWHRVFVAQRFHPVRPSAEDVTLWLKDPLFGRHATDIGLGERSDQFDERVFGPDGVRVDEHADVRCRLFDHPLG